MRTAVADVVELDLSFNQILYFGDAIKCSDLETT